MVRQQRGDDVVCGFQRKDENDQGRQQTAGQQDFCIAEDAETWAAGVELVTSLSAFGSRHTSSLSLTVRLPGAPSTVPLVTA